MRMRVWAPPRAPTPARRKSHSCRWGILIRNRPPAVMKCLVLWPDRLRGTGDAIESLWPTVPIQHAKGSKRSLDTRPKPLKPRFHSGLRNQCGFWLEARLQGRYTLFLGHTPELCDVRRIGKLWSHSGEQDWRLVERTKGLPVSERPTCRLLRRVPIGPGREPD